jgi:hypothetical protein
MSDLMGPMTDPMKKVTPPQGQGCGWRTLFWLAGLIAMGWFLLSLCG